MDIIWIILAIMTAVALLGIMIFLIKSKKSVDYYTFFITGCSWIVLGIALQSYAFAIIGVGMMAISLIHRKEWKKNRVNWSKANMTRWIVLAIILFILAAIIAQVIAFFVK
jgi:hypothetical protein